VGIDIWGDQGKRNNRGLERWRNGLGRTWNNSEHYWEMGWSDV